MSKPGQDNDSIADLVPLHLQSLTSCEQKPQLERPPCIKYSTVFFTRVSIFRGLSRIVEQFHPAGFPPCAFIEDIDSVPSLHLQYSGGAMSSHIDNHRLFEAVSERTLLDTAEVEHLSTCEECLEKVRVFVKQILAKSANPE